MAKMNLLVNLVLVLQNICEVTYSVSTFLSTFLVIQIVPILMIRALSTFLVIQIVPILMIRALKMTNKLIQTFQPSQNEFFLQKCLNVLNLRTLRNRFLNVLTFWRLYLRTLRAPPCIKCPRPTSKTVIVQQSNKPFIEKCFAFCLKPWNKRTVERH